MSIWLPDEVLIVDWDADTPHFPDPPADELYGQGERQDEQHREYHDENTPSPKGARWREYFPHPAGLGIRRGATMFESLCHAQVANEESIWGTFTDEADWDLARWIITSGTTHTSADELLDLKKVSKPCCQVCDLLKASQIRKAGCVSFHNTRSLLQKIDALPSGPKWTCELFEVEGDILNESGAPETKTVELWRRNPVECIRDLIGNPEFKRYMKYAPYRLYMNEDGTDQCWDEMATGSWWWDTQVRNTRWPVN